MIEGRVGPIGPGRASSNEHAFLSRLKSQLSERKFAELRATFREGLSNKWLDKRSIEMYCGNGIEEAFDKVSRQEERIKIGREFLAIAEEFLGKEGRFDVCAFTLDFDGLLKHPSFPIASDVIKLVDKIDEKLELIKTVFNRSVPNLWDESRLNKALEFAKQLDQNDFGDAWPKLQNFLNFIRQEIIKSGLQLESKEIDEFWDKAFKS